MKQPRRWERSTDGRKAILGLVAVVAVNFLIFLDPWHYIKSRWPAMESLETVFVIVVFLILLCMFGAVLRASYFGFWPTMYSLVDWHRTRAEKRDAPLPRNRPGPPTFSSNFTNDLGRIARFLLVGALGMGCVWSLYAFIKWVTH
jgi:hypothetical protein